MAGNFNIKNANGKTLTIQNPDTNNADIVIDGSKIASTVSPVLTGNPTAPTPTALDNSTKVATTAYVDGKMVRGTAITASGTSIDFTGIPLWVKRVTIMFNGVSTNGSSNVHVQLGDSVGVETSGYVAAGEQQNTQVAYTTGFGIPYNASTNLLTGIFEIAFFNGTTYVTSGILGTQATCGSMQGSKTLTGTLDRVRITTVNGTDTFDAGSINILYEG